MSTPLLAGDLSGGLPGSNVSKDDLPDGPKPGQALKNLPSGTAGSQVSEQVRLGQLGQDASWLQLHRGLHRLNMGILLL